MSKRALARGEKGGAEAAGLLSSASDEPVPTTDAAAEQVIEPQWPAIETRRRIPAAIIKRAVAAVGFGVSCIVIWELIWSHMFSIEMADRWALMGGDEGSVARKFSVR